jgi:uncharacterized protein (UPF0147 family)
MLPYLDEEVAAILHLLGSDASDVRFRDVRTILAQLVLDAALDTAIVRAATEHLEKLKTQNINS